MNTLEKAQRLIEADSKKAQGEFRREEFETVCDNDARDVAKALFDAVEALNMLGSEHLKLGTLTSREMAREALAKIRGRK